MDPLTLKDFDLSPEDLKVLVDGSQKYLPPVEDTDDTIPKPAVDESPKT